MAGSTWLARYLGNVVGWDVREPMPEDFVSEALPRALVVRKPAVEGLAVVQTPAEIQQQVLATLRGGLGSADLPNAQH